MTDSTVVNLTPLQSVRAIQERWSLSDEQLRQLLHLPEGTAIDAELEQNPEFAYRTQGLRSLAHHLSALCRSVQEEVDWLSRPHPNFDQNRPMDVALSSPEALAWLNYCLDSDRFRKTKEPETTP